MTRQVPSVGRIVHYRSRGSADGAFQPQCVAAIITLVWDDDGDGQEVGLSVLNPAGLFFAERIRHDQEGLSPGSWHWPEQDAPAEAAVPQQRKPADVELVERPHRDCPGVCPCQ